jgi:hypothetical protein
MVFRRKKILSQWFDSIGKKILVLNRLLILLVKNEKSLTNGSILSAASMTDSIGINPSPIMPSQMLRR